VRLDLHREVVDLPGECGTFVGHEAVLCAAVTLLPGRGPERMSGHIAANRALRLVVAIAQYRSCMACCASLALIDARAESVPSSNATLILPRSMSPVAIPRATCSLIRWIDASAAGR